MVDVASRLHRIRPTPVRRGRLDLTRVSGLHRSGWSDKAFVTNAIIMRYERDGTLVVIIYSNLVIKLYVAWHDRV